MSLTGSARLAGVVGWPVAQSLSPALHGYWLAKHGIDAAYVPLPVEPVDFSHVMEALRRTGFRGVNVTVPHKEAAFALANHLDPEARAIGAVNLLTFDNHGFEGRNTDAVGMAASLTEAGVRVAGHVAAIWGAGGAARAAIHALAGMGACEIRLFNRTAGRAQALASAFAPRAGVPVTAAGYDTWSSGAKDVALVVHTTSAGMKGKPPSLDLPLDGLPADAAVFDSVYNPLQTELLSRARARGLKVVDGLGMLMHQAVPAFEAFFGVRPAVTPELRRTLEAELHG